MEYQPATTYRAQRCLVHIGSISLTVFQLPDGSYRLSQKEVAGVRCSSLEKEGSLQHRPSMEQPSNSKQGCPLFLERKNPGVIDKPARSSFAFLHSKQLKSILGADFNVSPKFEKVAVEGSQGLITPIPIELALLYWHKWAQQENAKALALVLALAKQSIYSAADEAFGITRTKQERDRLFRDALSERGIDQIEGMRQSLNQQMFDSQSETQTERELKLKIQLAEIELSQQRLQSAKDSNNYPAKDIDKIGVPPWVVIPWTQKTLGWSDATAAFRLLRRLGYGFKGEKWFTLKVVGELWLLPWPAFEALTKAVEKFKSELN